MSDQLFIAINQNKDVEAQATARPEIRIKDRSAWKEQCMTLADPLATEGIKTRMAERSERASKLTEGVRVSVGFLLVEKGAPKGTEPKLEFFTGTIVAVLGNATYLVFYDSESKKRSESDHF